MSKLFKCITSLTTLVTCIYSQSEETECVKNIQLFIPLVSDSTGLWQSRRDSEPRSPLSLGPAHAPDPRRPQGPSRVTWDAAVAALLLRPVAARQAEPGVREPPSGRRPQGWAQALPPAERCVLRPCHARTLPRGTWLGQLGFPSPVNLENACFCLQLPSKPLPSAPATSAQPRAQVFTKDRQHSRPPARRLLSLRKLRNKELDGWPGGTGNGQTDTNERQQ